MVSRRLPPLNALRGFEAAARFGSFAKAADELALTQSAVSHQVRQLEHAFGQPLFLRHGRELSLTDAGRDFLATVRAALNQLSVGFERLAPYKEPESVIVSCDAAFARYWLLPRLPAFRVLHPRIAVWLDTSEQLLDFERQEVEIVIGRLRATGAGCIEETLFDDYLTAAVRRNSAEPHWRLADLVEHVLLHDERRENWLVWMRQQNLPVNTAAAGLRFSDPGLALDAAKSGHGVALVSDVLALDDLRTGTLRAPFEHRLHLPDEYRMAHPKALANEPPIAAFMAFMRAAALKYRGELSAYRTREP
jgi:LysR family transcriptional regulator, glycine cleavage system transcriptional activator